MGSDIKQKQTEEVAPKAMARYPDVDRGWAWLVMIANYVGVSILCGTMFMGGVFYIALLNQYGEGKAKTSVVGALSTGLLCFCGPVASICINKIGCRLTLMLGGVIITLASLVSAFVHSLDVLIVTAGALTGIGYSISCGALIVSLGYYFEARRNLILSGSFVMIGTGLFLSAPTGIYILETYGLSGSFLILGCINAQLVVVGMICRPSSIERSLQENRNSSVYEDGEEQVRLFNVALLKNTAFLCFLISTTTWNFALNIGVMHLPNFISLRTSSDSQIGLLMTVYSVSNTTGRLIGSLTVGKANIDCMPLHVISIGICGIMTALFPLYSDMPAGYYVFAIQLGLCTGVPNTLMTPLSIRMVGVKGLSEAHGFTFFFCGIGVTAGPVVAGYVFGATGSYEYSFLISGVILIVGSLFGVAAAVILRRNPPDTDADKDLTSDTETFVPRLDREKSQRANITLQEFIYGSNGSVVLL